MCTPLWSVLTHCRGKPFEKSLLHVVESVVIEWTHQIHDVLKKSSAQCLLDGKYPLPLVELDFWKARAGDLESVRNQVGEYIILASFNL